MWPTGSDVMVESQLTSQQMHLMHLRSISLVRGEDADEDEDEGGASHFHVGGAIFQAR